MKIINIFIIISDSVYFDLKTNKWVSIASLPNNCRDTSTLLLEQEILISCYVNYMFSYNTFTNQYLNYCNGLHISYQNILLFYSNKIFLLANPNLYICEDWKSGKKWRQINSGFVFEHTTSKPCFYGKYAYFFTHVNKIYRLDCESFALTMIKQL